MTESRWRRNARATIRRVLEDLPADATDAQKRKAVSEAYPFGERAHHPYKMWLAEIKAQLGRRNCRRAETEDIRAELRITREGPNGVPWYLCVSCGWCGSKPAGCLVCGRLYEEIRRMVADPEFQRWRAAMTEDATAVGPCSDWFEENGHGDLAAQLRALAGVKVKEV